MTKQQPGTLFDFFISRRFVVFLFLAFLLLTLIGVFVPQETIVPQADFITWQNSNPDLSIITDILGVNRLFIHPLFITTVVLLAVSIALCTYRRTAVIFNSRRSTKEVSPPNLKQFSEYLHIKVKSPQNESANRIEHIIRKACKGFHVVRSLTGEFFFIKAKKGVRGNWGSVLFHFSFILLLLGALLSVWTRFEGKFLLTEGQFFEGLSIQYANKNNPPFFSPEQLGFQLQLQKFIPSVIPQKEYARDRVKVLAQNGEEFTSDIRKYHALTYKGFTFYQREHGFSPSFEIISPNEQKIFHSYIAFRTQRIGEDFLFEDAFEIPGTDYKIYGRLYPDAFKVDGKLASRTNKPDNPVLSLMVSRKNKEIHRGEVALHQRLEFDNYILFFDDLRYWSSFRVVRDYGIPIIYFGFFIGIVGLLIRLFINQQEILVEITDDRQGHSSIRIFGKTEREKAFFGERINKLVKELKSLEEAS